MFELNLYVGCKSRC